MTLSPHFNRAVCSLVFCVVLCVVPFAVAVTGQTGAAAKNPLVGRWKSSVAVIEIRADGTIKINDDEYVYKIKNAVITVSSDEGSLAFPYSLDGDTLTVDAQGQEIVYTRIKDKESGGRGSGQGSGIGSGDGAIVPEFVGKWCYLANLGGTSSYRNDRCFTLYANGTYEYYGETSSSGNDAGSSVGSSYDTGRWVATRNTLTAFSNAHGKIVYPIELRNHPKNGDPMIVVDGDAYVTQTQRRPW